MAQPHGFERFTVTTGGDEERHIAERRDAYFAHVIAELGLPTDFPWAEHIRRLAKNLHFEGPDKLYPTDDWLYQLIVCDETLAMVLDRRTTANYHEVSFWRSEPSQRCMGRIATVLAAQQEPQQT